MSTTYGLSYAEMTHRQNWERAQNTGRCDMKHPSPHPPPKDTKDEILKIAEIEKELENIIVSKGSQGRTNTILAHLSMGQRHITKERTEPNGDKPLAWDSRTESILHEGMGRMNK